jgi:pyruvate kinase
MAARGDLYIEMVRPHRIIHALNTIIQADSQAFVASRIFDSLVHNPVPSSADISDAAWLISMGYRNFLFGDLICLQKDTILEGLNLLTAIAGQVL